MSNLLNPTFHFHIGYFNKLPYLEKMESKDLNNKIILAISLSKSDWDLRETSWDFRRAALLTDYSEKPVETVIDENLTDISWPSGFGKITSLEKSYQSFAAFWTEQFKTLHRLEEENNRFFIDLYGLGDELTPDVPYAEITILQEELDEKARKRGEIVFLKDEVMKQFVSYAVGCIVGRYSLDLDGLILANAGETLVDYLNRVPEPSYMPDEDGIVPLTEEEDFTDDLPARIREFVRIAFGEKEYETNMRYLEGNLGKPLREYLLKNFYADHVQRYKKRPIYWMVTSPSSAFRCLIYLHRYTPETLGRIVNDYLRPFIRKLEAKIGYRKNIVTAASGSAAEKNRAQKQIDAYRQQIEELNNWDRDVLYPLAAERIALDLDDGVKVNYAKLGAVLETVKGLNG